MNQLVTSMPKDILLRTSFTERGKSTPVQATEEVRVKSHSSFTRKVRFTDAREEYEPALNCSSGDKTMSGESGTFEPAQDDLSGETRLRQPKDRMLSGEPGSRRPRDRVFLGSRETSQTDRNPSARVMCPHTLGVPVVGKHIGDYFQFGCFGDCNSFLVGGMETARAGPGNASGSRQRQVYL